MLVTLDRRDERPPYQQIVARVRRALPVGTRRAEGSLSATMVRPGEEERVGFVLERQDAPYRSLTCASLLRRAAARHPARDHAYADHPTRALGVRPQRRVGGPSTEDTIRLVLALRPPLLQLDGRGDGFGDRWRMPTSVALAAPGRAPR